MKTNLPLLKTLGSVALAAAATLAAQAGLTLQHLSTYHHGGFAVGAAEIAAYDPGTQRIFVVNAQAATVDVLDISSPETPVKVGTINAIGGGAANSVAVRDGVVAVAIEAAVKQEPGTLAFFKTSDLSQLASVTVGALPDMVTFTPDGKYALVANEGEPNANYTLDPEGSISIIDVSKGAANVTQADVRTAGFEAFNKLDPKKEFTKEKIRIFGPNANAAQNFEPEYIAVAADSKTAYVTLQEANAIAIVDIRHAKVKQVRGLGAKNYNLANNGFGSSNALDPSDRDSAIKIGNWPVHGLYMPDGIAAFESAGETFLITANEGDARAYDAFNEESRAGAPEYVLDPTAFPNAGTLRQVGNLGRLRTTLANGDTDGDGDFDEIYTYGARSFTIRAANGQLLWDSGDQFEQIVAQANPTFFNSNHEANRFDDRSDDKGPEPEGLAIGTAFGKPYAFIGLERVGGVMVFDLSNPVSPAFVTYVNNRNFSAPTTITIPGTPPQVVPNPAAGDLGPEGLLFIKADESPTGQPLLVISNEVSGTTSFFAISPGE